MSESDEDSVLKAFRDANGRRRNRDQVYLRTSKMNAMTILAYGFREWIVQEAKDLLMLIETLRKMNNQGIIAEISFHEGRIREIQRTFMKKTIAPMKKVGQGGTGAKNEEEHCRKFRIALDNVFGVILELQEIRKSLDAIFATIFSMESQRREPHEYIS